jgi:hypothetical protein
MFGFGERGGGEYPTSTVPYGTVLHVLCQTGQSSEEDLLKLPSDSHVSLVSVRDVRFQRETSL